MSRLLFVVFAGLAAASVIRKSDNLEVIDGEYIVVFHDNVTSDSVAKHMGLLGDAKVMFTYDMPTFKGYAISTYENHILTVAEAPEVKYIEHNGMAYAYQVCTTNNLASSWGLARVSNRQSVTSGPYRVEQQNGAGSHVFIIDTGLLTTHQVFEGRARDAPADRFDSTGEGPGDQNGHGTHCGGTAAGQTYGIARQSSLFEVKVLGRSGGGSFAGVIAGINWVANRPERQKVGSMSLGGGFNGPTNDATDAAVRAGSIMSVASGNSNANACNFSPASAPLNICVNSMQVGDARSGFSNFGTCTDVFAPGTSITSAWIGSNTAINTISGTSMACPHITGIAAAAWSASPASDNHQIKSAILAKATENVITNPGAGSPNRLGFTCN